MATDDTTTTDDITTTDDSQAGTAATKAATTDDKATDATKAELERVKRALSEANRKALADRKRLEDIDKENEARETAKLGEAEQLKRQLKTLEAEKHAAEQESAQLKADLLAKRIDTEIERAAMGHFLHPEIAPQVVDRERINHDPETGRITGIKDAIDAVLKKYPGLGTARRGGGSPAAMQTKQPGSGGTGGGGKGDKEPGLREEFLKLGNYEVM